MAYARSRRWTSPALPPAIATLLFLFAIALGAACSDGEYDGAGATPTGVDIPSVAGPQDQPAPAQPLSSMAVEPQGGVVELTTEGALFVQNLVRLPAGEPVTIRVTNKDTAQHNLRIAGIDGQYDTEDDAVTSPAAIDEGAAGELTFAPPVAGAYTFRCDFHPGSMGGQIVAADDEGSDSDPEPAPSTEATRGSTGSWVTPSPGA